ncbi:unnamed protein product [Musa acuminata subsp. malaccensis]|uniref:(wild Malaysian banana) hypothetical protein n=1 Tax=Musa acuminata subsp. malaccensis TaxID=214687 RepID=A0A804J762_MUSAM|nr:unnamed protein product [Musa acuminata subsp. malaccensis]
MFNLTACRESIETTELLCLIALRRVAFRPHLNRLMKLLSMTKINILMEVEIHNHALDQMGHDMDTSSGVLSGTVDRFKMVFERKLNCRMATLVISFLVLFLLMYYLTK